MLVKAIISVELKSSNPVSQKQSISEKRRKAHFFLLHREIREPCYYPSLWASVFSVPSICQIEISSEVLRTKAFEGILEDTGTISQ